MRRMQVVVEEWQYEVLRAIAGRQGKSVSAILREMISSQISKTSGKDPLLEAAGIAQATPEKDLGSETIDERLYKA
ncbi:hypothetical protein Tph_c01950 [Thermacetogenium phaeum DSM 12270]|uniref:Ribbon-helix-helix protein CopG domain-containing protein n=1 Tax=Thermacetogenium phaeum (strain ATCC BAA-254 / DSM 26808 / PB) TaxID=1089553 RepID=K4LED3_THEPS|nr:hypothetical protein [Thermacetogenium phaeum]AFV10442.1 hypothetical protein Tph_c01950 [Thermacetogenium phaeum DSM 12270]MDK2881235.1 hypothetical protein [Clostridia bacterium]MDN5366498.1 hypothetical protein [Thermacetogenium sp.]MDN5375915.1 hypothetical protein [Thermacetogenium sp.]